MRDSSPDWMRVPKVNAFRSPQYINTKKLTPAQRQRLWQGMQICDPALAEMLSKDAVFKQLKAAFQAEVLIESDDANRYLNAAQQSLSNG